MSAREFNRREAPLASIFKYIGMNSAIGFGLHGSFLHLRRQRFFVAIDAKKYVSRFFVEISNNAKPRQADDPLFISYLPFSASLTISQTGSLNYCS